MLKIRAVRVRFEGKTRQCDLFQAVQASVMMEVKMATTGQTSPTNRRTTPPSSTVKSIARAPASRIKPVKAASWEVEEEEMVVGFALAMVVEVVR